MKNVSAFVAVALMSVPLCVAEEGAAQNKFGQDFLKHWTTARELTLAVAQAMPPDSYDFKPNPGEMSFGEQMVHIAGGNYSYCSRISGSKSPFVKPEKADQATALDMVKKSFDYCAETIGAAKDLEALRGPEGRQSSVRELMLGVLTHMAHHRGQAEVYLRVKGITPPVYKF